MDEAQTDFRYWPSADGWQEAQIRHHLAWVAQQGFTSIKAVQHGSGVLVEYVDKDGIHFQHFYFAYGFVDAASAVYRLKGKKQWHEIPWPDDPRYEQAPVRWTQRKCQNDTKAPREE